MCLVPLVVVVDDLVGRSGFVIAVIIGAHHCAPLVVNEDGRACRPGSAITVIIGAHHCGMLVAGVGGWAACSWSAGGDRRFFRQWWMASPVAARNTIAMVGSSSLATWVMFLVGGCW